MNAHVVFTALCWAASLIVARAADVVRYAPADRCIACRCELANLRHASFDPEQTRHIDFHETWNLLEHGVVVERRWTAYLVDATIRVVEQNIFITDLIAPQLVKGQQHVTWTDGEIPAPVFADNCGEKVSVEYEDAEIAGLGFDRIYTATDRAGNRTTFIQQVRYPQPAAAQAGTVISFTREKVNHDDCFVTYTRTDQWIGHDGTQAEIVNQYLEADLLAPVVNYAPYVERPADDFGGSYLSCDEGGTIMDQEDSWLDEGALLERTYRVADRCGNETVAVQQIALLKAAPDTASEAAPDGALTVQLWPNPAGEQVFVAFGLAHACDWHLELYGAAGQLIDKTATMHGLAQSRATGNFNTGHLSPGTYLVLVVVGDQRITRTFVVGN